MKKYKVIYFGTWGYGKAGLAGLLHCSNVEIVSVFTKWNPDQPDIYMDQVKNLAEEHGVPVQNTLKSICSKSLFEENVLAYKNVDFIISCCFDRIFTSRILALPRIKALNIHPSLLPKYRGIKPLENAMVNGDTETGISLHELTPTLDAGDIVLQKAEILITPYKNYQMLYDEQCHNIRQQLGAFFEAPLHYLKNAIPQSENQVSWAPRLSFEIKNWMNSKLISLFDLAA